MKLTFLGTGTSFGVPVVGCRCDTCTSDDPRDRRTRHGALLEIEGARLLVDAPPELRLQLVRARVEHLDAAWITHLHADHVHGIDDLRIFTARSRRALRTLVPAEYEDELRRRFRYIFDERVQPPEGTTKPRIALEPFGSDLVEICGATFRPLAVPHPPVTAYGFRVGALGYITDAKEIPSEVADALKGVEVLVLNSLWFGKKHPTHLVIEEAVEIADSVGAARTYLTHLTHRVLHAELEARLPRNVRPAYDDLTIEI